MMTIKDTLKKLTKSTFLKNTGWLVFAQVYQMIIQLVIGVISARYLGPKNYGTLGYAAAYISFFTIASTLGMEGIVIREMIENRDKEGEILGSAILFRFCAGIVSMVVVCILVFFINPGDRTLLVVAFLQSIVLMFNSFNIIDMWYQSYLRSKVSALIKCTAYTAMSCYKILLLVYGKSVVWFAFSISFDSILIAVLFLFYYKRHGSSPLRINISVGKKIIKLSYHLMISSLMAVVYNQMDKLMIGKMIGQTEVGYYTAATTISHMWMFIPQAFTNSAQPLILKLKKENVVIYDKRTAQLLSFLFWLGIVFAIIITACAPIIVNILYGKEYSIATIPLSVSVWGMVFSCLSYPRAVWMLAENKQHYVKKILVWGVVINLVLNSILISVIGIVGAAVATLVTEISCCLIIPFFFKEIRPFVRLMIKSIVGRYE